MQRQRRSGRSRTRAAVVAACLPALLGAAAATAGAQSGDSGMPEAAAAAAAAPPAKATRITEARVRPGKAYYFGLKQIRFAIKLAAKNPTDVRIDIVRRSGVIERSIVQLDVQPNVLTTVPWDGLSGAGTAVRGKLRFLIRGVNGEKIGFAKRYAVNLKSKRGRKRGPKLNFGFFDHIFPVRGKHSYGDGLGAGRGHRGQDVPAKCNTKLVAAQGGTVQVVAFQDGGAGFYVVIDTVGSDIDHVYMHLAYPPPLALGQVVMTGQPIGAVGSTGHSTGCHLHFEMWSGPGWFEGGTFLDANPYLRAWDKYS